MCWCHLKFLAGIDLAVFVVQIFVFLTICVGEVTVCVVMIFNSILFGKNINALIINFYLLCYCN